MSVVIDVHNMRTESDASPARDAPVLFAFLEFHAGCQLRLRIRALVAIYPKESFSELADQQILDPVAVEIADKRRRVALKSTNKELRRRIVAVLGIRRIGCGGNSKSGDR